MYIIIGGDQKEYGPITTEDLRKWIAEGRLNAQSLTKAESDAEFRPLSTFPEFADLFGLATQAGAPPSLSPAGIGSREAAFQQVKTPAVALKVTAILNMIFALWGVVKLVFFRSNIEQLYSGMPQFNDPQVQKILHLAYGPLGVASNFFGLAMSVLVFIGASKMQSLRSYEFAFTAALLAMIPCLTPCCMIGLPFGIWALVVLNKPEVKSHFS